MKRSSPRHLRQARQREVPRAGFFRVSYHTARRKRRTVCPHKELQSAFISFIASERMRYKSLRTDKRKTARPFFTSRLHQPNPSSAEDFFASPIKEKRAKRFSTLDFINQIRAVVVRGTSVYPSLPYFCSAKIRDRSAK